MEGSGYFMLVGGDRQGEGCNASINTQVFNMNTYCATS